jgi:hypothetical protein
VATIDSDVKRLQALIEAERGAPIDGKILETRPNVLDDPKRGFKSWQDFAVAVVGAGVKGPRAVDERLSVVAAAPGTFGNENVGQDGGYLVPTEFASSITKLSLDSDAFLPRCEAMPVSGNSVTFPSDETTPWGTNGVRVYWAAEAALATATKPILKPNTMRLNKLLGLVPLTDELLADAPAMAAYVQAQLGRSIKWKVNDAIINGDGAGQPLGILNAGALVVIAIEGGQGHGHAARAQRREDVRRDAGRLPRRRRVGHRSRPAAAAHDDGARQQRHLDAAARGFPAGARRFPLRQADHVLADVRGEGLPGRHHLHQLQGVPDDLEGWRADRIVDAPVLRRRRDRLPRDLPRGRPARA